MDKKSKLGFLWENMEGCRGLYIWALASTVLSNVLQLTMPHYSGQLTDRYITGEHAAENLANDRQGFWMLLALMIGFVLLRGLVFYFGVMAYEKSSQCALYNIRNGLYNRIERQDMTFFAKYRTGDLMTRVTGDLDAMRHMIAWVLRMLLQCIVLYGSAAVYFLFVNWKLALSLLAFTPLICLLVYRYHKAVKPYHVALRERFSEMNTNVQENISGNRVVRAFAREDFENEKFEKINRGYSETNKATSLVWRKYSPWVEMCTNLLPVVLLLMGGYLLIKDQLTMGEYVTFSGLIFAVSNPMRSLGDILNEFQRFSAASDKVMEIWYEEAQIRDPEEPAEAPERFAGEVEFRNVSFSYPDGNIPVLENISFTVKPGQTLAIMGETGCGKTSLINLIPRFYDPTEGEVLLDGIPVNRLPLKKLRKSLGVATQDVLLYSDSIEDNIAYGDSFLKRPEVRKYAHYSQAASFIDHMPETYDTIIGERGLGLSGGQKQRIALARALAVKPSVLILDDTTSAVDMETEKLIQEGLRQLDFPCTKIIIAQRISTTRSADQILVLDKGRIREMGTHEELIARKGYYYELVKLQTGLDRELEEVIARTASQRKEA